MTNLSEGYLTAGCGRGSPLEPIEKHEILPSTSQQAVGLLPMESLFEQWVSGSKTPEKLHKLIRSLVAGEDIGKEKEKGQSGESGFRGGARPTAQ